MLFCFFAPYGAKVRLQNGFDPICMICYFVTLLPPFFKTMAHSMLAPLLALRGVWYVGKEWSMIAD